VWLLPAGGYHLVILTRSIDTLSDLYAIGGIEFTSMVVIHVGPVMDSQIQRKPHD